LFKHCELGMVHPLKRGAKQLAAWFLVACLLVDCFPRYGAPDFRYTGSDPAHSVWNFGFSFVIYDSSSGFHLGPFAVILIPAEVFVGLLIFLVPRFLALKAARTE
jgi:hypothetical protein